MRFPSTVAKTLFFAAAALVIRATPVTAGALPPGVYGNLACASDGTIAKGGRLLLVNKDGTEVSAIVSNPVTRNKDRIVMEVIIDNPGIAQASGKPREEVSTEERSKFSEIRKQFKYVVNRVTRECVDRAGIFPLPRALSIFSTGYPNTPFTTSGTAGLVRLSK